MSRSGYSDDCYGWDLIRWRGAVTSAMFGRRGQKFFREMLIALDALEEKRLISEELANGQGVCAIGAVGEARGLDMSKIDPWDRSQVSESFGIAPALAAEIAFMNDEGTYRVETPETRFARMRAWVVAQIREET